MKFLLFFLAGILVLIDLLFLFLFLCWLFVDPKKEYDKDSRFYRALLNGAAGAALKLLRIHVKVSGEEKLPADSPVLFICNHRSNFDPIITWYVFRKYRPAFISKEANFHIPFFGRYIRRCCFMAIDREDPREAMKTIRRAAGLLKEGEMSVGVYPEGTRSRSGELLPFHNGVFKIAQLADVPIVVLSIKGTETIHKNVPFHASSVQLDVLDVLPAGQIRSLRTSDIGGRVREEISEKLASGQ